MLSKLFIVGVMFWNIFKKQEYYIMENIKPNTTSVLSTKLTDPEEHMEMSKMF